MMLAAMLAMVLVAAAPALAQTQDQDATSQYGDITQQQCQNVANVQYNDLDDSTITIIQSCINAGFLTVDVLPPEVVEVIEVTPVTESVTVVEEEASATLSVLPDTGGASLIALGAGALLVGGGLLARRIIR